MNKLINTVLFSLVFLYLNACAKETALTKPTTSTAYTATTVTSGINTPWGMTFLSDDKIIITEKAGKLWVIDLTTNEKKPIVKGLPKISQVGQGGLLDVEIDPEFDKNQWIYLSYTYGENDNYGTEVGRGKLVGDEIKNFETFFVAQPKKTGGRHFGSRLVFDNEGYLFITLGDRGHRKEAQDLSSHIGTVIRLHKDGTIPKDNPFVNTPKAKPEIFSYGHRNIQGAAKHPKTGQLFTHEHGPQGGDEINAIYPKHNYGWPDITYGKEYGTGFKIGKGTEKKGVTPPLYQWTPSIAPSGMAFYFGDEFPQWEGNILVGALKFQLVSRLSHKGSTLTENERLFESEFGRIRDIIVDKKGKLYLLTDAEDGKLIRIEKS